MKSDFELSLEYEKHYLKNKKIYIHFNYNIFSVELGEFNNKEMDNREKEIKKRLIEQIPKDERIFFNISSYSRKYVEYEFDIEKWFKKSISQTIINTPDRFEKKIKVNKLPSMVLNYVDTIMVENIINGSFRNYLEKTPKVKKIILNSMTCVVKPLISYFSFKYDGFGNCIIISLKPEFRINPLVLIKADENKPKKEIKKMGFDKTVYTLLSLK